eukprot:CAMPEP_0170491758 /NCGR_PEP_ID=MMETSP0208-20121228/11232_1 /TAXON_ID=197538 /ORGANISM="Strombidium inclinatum, Strain S3" /LENGTH=33 /DNA_ID= /DNA_START= /DNA_END= /DNA_ORIENTATION=
MSSKKQNDSKKNLAIDDSKMSEPIEDSQQDSDR